MIEKAHPANLPDCSFLVTSRPIASTSLASKLPFTLTVEGCSDDDIASIISDTSSEKGPQFLDSLKGKPSVYSLCGLPINLAIVKQLIQNLLRGQHRADIQLPFETQMLQSVVVNLLLRHFRKKQGYEPERDLLRLSELPVFLKPTFDALCQVAHFASFKYSSQSRGSSLLRSCKRLIFQLQRIHLV